MTERKLGSHNVTIGDYRVVEARPLGDPSPRAATWRVYFRQALDPLSEHRTCTEAVAAVARYRTADARRALHPKHRG